MSSFDYVKAREIARANILKYGAELPVIQKGSNGGYDSSGNLQPATPDTEINGVSTPFVSFTNKEVDGDTIISGDSWVYFQCDDDTQAPDVNMQMTQSGVIMRVMSVSNASSVSGIVIYHKLQLRK